MFSTLHFGHTPTLSSIFRCWVGGPGWPRGGETSSVQPYHRNSSFQPCPFRNEIHFNFNVWKHHIELVYLIICGLVFSFVRDILSMPKRSSHRGTYSGYVGQTHTYTLHIKTVDLFRMFLQDKSVNCGNFEFQGFYFAALVVQRIAPITQVFEQVLFCITEHLLACDMMFLVTLNWTAFIRFWNTSLCIGKNNGNHVVL